MIRATGGLLKPEAVFPEGKVETNQFRKLKKAAGADRDWTAPAFAKNTKRSATRRMIFLLLDQ
jgi:hypothetical protein